MAKHQEGMAFDIQEDQHANTNARVFVALPGGGVQIDRLLAMCGKVPKPIVAGPL